MMQDKLAVQMFTLRDYTKTAADFAATLERVRKIGYPAVQLSAVGCMGGDNPEVSSAEARRLLDANGLRCVATHRGWQALADNTAAEIEFHQQLGCDYAAIGGIPENYRNAGEAGYRQFIADAQPVIAKLKQAGIGFGYHNHAFEFQAAQTRKTCYDVLVDEGDADLLLEIDTFWLMHAGIDPVAMIKRCHGRLPVVHLKDKAVSGNDGVFAPIGEGNLNWPAILPSFAAAGTNWYCIEQDNCFERDPFDCLKSSFDFLANF